MFLAAERLRGEDVERHLRTLECAQWQPREQARALSEARLASLLSLARERNRFYRLRCDYGTTSWSLRDLPILTKSELRANFREIVTPGYEHSVTLCKTSGSTGEPLKFYRDRVVFGYTLASVYRAQRWYGLEIGSPYAMLWGMPSTPRARAVMRVRDFALNRFREREYDLSPGVLSDFYRSIQRRRPEFLFGYSSMVYEFALFVVSQGLDGRTLGLKAAICTAESVHDHQREVIAQAFGCPVVSEYGSAETGIISYQCPAGSHHVSDDVIHLELLDESGQEVPDGAVGRVVVTVLHSHCAPIIRYELGDYAVRRPGICSCGVTLPMLDRIVGRTSGVIVTPSGTCYHSIAVYYVMKEFADRFGGVRQFRVVQTAVDQLEFLVVPGQEFSIDAEGWLRNAIQRRFGGDMRVNVVKTDRIERSPSGKLSDFESRIDADARMMASFRKPVFAAADASVRRS